MDNDGHSRAPARAAEFTGDPWQCSIELTSIDDNSSIGSVRAVRAGDEALLAAFGNNGLSADSRQVVWSQSMHASFLLTLPCSLPCPLCFVLHNPIPPLQKFECYSWMSDLLISELQAAIALSLGRRDLHLLALDKNEVPIGYVFLWAASDDIPELGLAVADAWHGRRIGTTLLRLVDQMGRQLGKQALELTTMQDNKRALAVYLGAGWEHLGVIHNPLGCDVKQAFRV